MDPVSELRRRLAAGEIDAAEYTRTLELLASSDARKDVPPTGSAFGDALLGILLGLLSGAAGAYLTGVFSKLAFGGTGDVFKPNGPFEYSLVSGLIFAVSMIGLGLTRLRLSGGWGIVFLLSAPVVYFIVIKIGQYIILESTMPDALIQLPRELGGPTIAIIAAIVSSTTATFILFFISLGAIGRLDSMELSIGPVIMTGAAAVVVTIFETQPQFSNIKDSVYWDFMVILQASWQAVFISGFLLALRRP